MKRAFALAIMCLVAIEVGPARATTVLNLGVDILRTGAQSTVSFYDGGDGGVTLDGGIFFFGARLTDADTLEIQIDTQSLLADYAVLRGELFIDAVNLSTTEVGTVYGGGTHLGNLQNTTAAATRIPIEHIFGGRTVGAPNDVDNTFLTLSSQVLDDMKASSSYILSITNASTLGFMLLPRSAGSFRVDGINLQFEVEALAGSVDPSAVPEPSTLALGGLSVLALATGAAWRRRSARASA